MDCDVTDLYPLTSLQIGDVQSYLSQAYLFFAIYSHKFLILVDNHSWRMHNNHSKSTHLRELFATKYRTSPFKNSRALLRRVSARYKDNSISSNDERKKLYRWVSVVNSQRWRAKAFFSLVDLHVALHGFIVFEVRWEDIRGINYISELQTDISMAFEVKSMRKWDFHSIDQAFTCIESWFSGSRSEKVSLSKSLMILNDKVPSQSPRKVKISFKDLVENGKHTKSSSIDDLDLKECNQHSSDPSKTPRKLQESDLESVHYKHTLLKFYFDDRDLPFTFKRIITSDLKLLTLLETGLPSWVIFLQSYPLFCSVYRPWMRPLVRMLYVLISLVTCVIGFYDLYKNVPLLKDTASHICGPLIDWIEDWDMISRVRYLGTMLFIQNFEKAMRWSLKIGRVLKLMLLILTKPLMEPLQDLMEFTSPVWVLFCEVGLDLYRSVSFVLVFISDLFLNLLELLFSPFQLLYSYISTIVSFFSPIFASLWELCRVPLQICSSSAVSFCCRMYEVFQTMVMLTVNRVVEVSNMATKLSKAKPTTTEVFKWNSLLKDLFSKVFRSLRSISYGLIVFLDTCNRHRLSTSNYLNEFMSRMSELLSPGLEASSQAPPPLEVSKEALPSLSLENSHQILPEENCLQHISHNQEHLD
ncbi:uncharacterized protein LOC130813084 [Amaranthus tricolor]|uniref:uncharacterized protein LOC130813084 n=1 Tax=Amaranthus tricolor TaxID=29722 RepID=UPI00258DA36B|nr:uncharacterized protein LOC130813084 [Amaranthus tricolor]